MDKMALVHVVYCGVAQRFLFNCWYCFVRNYRGELLRSRVETPALNTFGNRLSYQKGSKLPATGRLCVSIQTYMDCVGEALGIGLSP